ELVDEGVPHLPQQRQVLVRLQVPVAFRNSAGRGSMAAGWNVPRSQPSRRALTNSRRSGQTSVRSSSTSSSCGRLTRSPSAQSPKLRTKERKRVRLDAPRGFQTFANTSVITRYSPCRNDSFWTSATSCLPLLHLSEELLDVLLDCRHHPSSLRPRVFPRPS